MSNTIVNAAFKSIAHCVTKMKHEISGHESTSQWQDTRRQFHAGEAASCHLVDCGTS